LVKKIPLPLQAPKSLLGEEAENWYREKNFIIRPVVLITTVSREGKQNASVKTNFMTVSSMKSYAFYCSPEHHTYRNILETGEFVVNVPTEDIIGKVLKVAKITVNPSPPGVNEIERAGLTPIPSEEVRPPRIEECVAHYECLLEWHKEALIFGKVVAVSVDKSFLEGVDTRKLLVIGAETDSYRTVGEKKKWPKVS
jgi:flavin reductase (DIM6/NTAB) family NADH-FMN oxidoreductase RutF